MDSAKEATLNRVYIYICIQLKDGIYNNNYITYKTINILYIHNYLCVKF